MTLLLRYFQPKRAGMWAKADDPALWKSGNFPYELLHDLHDPRGGLSFYQVKTRRDPDIKRIAAALNFPSKSTKDSIEAMEFRFVKIADVGKLGLSIKTTNGDTKDPHVNGLHREISGLDGRTAIKLAKMMCFSDSVAFGAKRVASEISVRIKSGILPDPSHTMLKTLLNEKAAKISYV
jgi:hypothetical protein